MTKHQFDEGMSRLERMFNHGLQLKDDVRKEYYTGLIYEDGPSFDDVVKGILETFKPFPTEPFPSLATIKIAILKMAEEAEGRAEEFHDTSELDFCQRCHNNGFFMDLEDVAHFCTCEKGRYRKAAWSVQGSTNRQERIQKALDKTPASEGPIRGLMEKNEHGFWEATEEEHNKWCDNERAKIAQMDEAIQRRAAGGKRVVTTDSLKRIVAEQIQQVKGSVRTDDQEVPF